MAEDRDAVTNGVNSENLREKLLKELNVSLEKAQQECKRYETTKTRLKEMAENEMRELYTKQESDDREESVSGANEYQSVSSDYQSRPVDYQTAKEYQSGPVEYQPAKDYPVQSDYSSPIPPTPDYQPVKEFHTAHQEYQTVPEYQTVQPEFQSVQPEYHSVPHQPSTPQQATRSPNYGSPTHRVVPLRRTESRTFVPAPPQQRSGSPLNFQPQNYPRPPPTSYRQNVNQPINQTQQYRPQLPRREESQSPNQEYQRVYINQHEKKPINFSPVQRDSQPQPQTQPQSPQSPQPPPIQRPTPQQVVRRPNPWALLKQKLPADVRQQFIPVRRPQFEGRAMQSPDQGMIQRPPGDGQPINTTVNKGGSPNPGTQSQNPVVQSPPPNPLYNGRPPSGNPPQKMGIPMQRPMSQEGRESPSPIPGQGMQRVMSGERRSPYEMQRTDSMRNIDPRSMPSPQPGITPPQGMYSPSPTRPPGPPRTPRPAGDDDDDVIYSQGNDSRMNLGRGQTPPLRPPSAPRPGPLSPDVNREMNSPRPLSRTESRQSFEVRSPSGMDNRGEPKLMTRDSPLSRPMSSADLARTPFQFRPESQHTPPSSPKPEFQSPKPPSISPQESLDRQKVESRSSTPQNPSTTPRITPDLRPTSKNDDKQDSGKLTPVSGGESRNPSPQASFDLSRPDSKQDILTDKSPIAMSPIVKSGEPSRSGTPSSLGGKDIQQNDPKSPNASQSVTPTPSKLGNDSGTGTPLPDKDSGSVTGSVREESPVKTPDRISTPDLSKKDIERPKSLKRSPSLKQDLANSPDNEGRRTPLARTPSRTSSAGKGNDDKSPLQRKASGKRPKTPKTPDGDHDSGVDETTQRKDGPTTNGDLGSPSKSPSKIPAPKRLSMPSPTKSTKASPKTPEAPPTADKKKVPMNKIQVGAAPSPNLKTVKSKIGSLQNTTHKPGGGNIKIENRKLDWRAEPRIAAKNDAYQPGGGDKKIQQVKLQWNAKSKIGSLENATHKPGGGEKKIENVKLDFKDKAKPKVGSKDNIKHTPGGGNIKTPSQDGSAEANSGDIEDHKLDVKAQSKIGSLDNVKHRPGGGDKKIFDDKDYLRQMSGTTSKAGSEGIPSGTQSPMHMSQSQVSVTDSC